MMLFLLYLIYLFECFNCQTRQSLSSATEIGQILPRINAAVKHDPQLWWLCFAYHYVRRRHRRCHCRPRYTEEVRFSTRLENGDVTAFGTKQQDRIITSVKQHFISESAALKYVWRDRSPQIEWNHEAAVKLTFVKEFIFADEATREQYEVHKRNFMKIQESSDDFMEIKEGKFRFFAFIYLITFLLLRWYIFESPLSGSILRAKKLRFLFLKKKGLVLASSQNKVSCFGEVLFLLPTLARTKAPTLSERLPRPLQRNYL